MQSEKYPNLRAKMVDLRKLGLDDFSLTAQPQPGGRFKLESRIEFEIALRFPRPGIATAAAPIAGDDLREAARRKSQHRSH